MPSSTSSSSSHSIDRAPPGPWGWTWGMAMVLVFVSLLGAEVFWRSRGHKPSIVDDPALWAYHRGRVYEKGEKTVVLAGASRILFGFSTPTFRDRFPDHRVIQLGINASSPVDTLADLAADKDFCGVVVCSSVPNQLYRYNRGSQEEYIECYHKHLAADSHLNLLARCRAQQYLVVMNPRVRLKAIWREWSKRRRLPRKQTYEIHFDRSRLADYRGWKNLEAIRRAKARAVNPDGRMKNPDVWLEHAMDIEDMVKRIQARGGAVVFTRLPTSGEAQVAREKRFPKELFWDRFREATSAETIHFQDIPAMAGLETPDSSHLDYRDAPRFTSALLDELVRRGMLKERRILEHY